MVGPALSPAAHGPVTHLPRDLRCLPCSRLIRTKAGAPRTVAKRMTSNDVFMGSSSLPYGPELQWARGGSGQKRKRPGIRERWHPRRPLGAPEFPPCRRSPLLLSLHNLGF